MHRKSIFFLSILLIFIWGFKNHTFNILTTGAPASSTGAPGENTCNVSGCHDGYPLNSGNALSSLMFDGSNNQFIPGNTYTITVSIEQNNGVRFGFELLALNEADQSNAGTFEIVDSVRTQIIPGIPGLEDRKYVTYKFYGTSPNLPDKSEWTVDWIAPSTSDDVTFYLATIAANNDGTDDGDTAYTSSLTINSALTSINTEPIENIGEVLVYPNPVRGNAKVRYLLNNKGYVKAFVYNHLGQRKDILFEGIHCSGEFTKEVSFSEYPPGVYFVILDVDGNRTTSKIIVLND